MCVVGVCYYMQCVCESVLCVVDLCHYMCESVLCVVGLCHCMCVRKVCCVVLVREDVLYVVVFVYYICVRENVLCCVRA